MENLPRRRLLRLLAAAPFGGFFACSDTPTSPPDGARPDGFATDAFTPSTSLPDDVGAETAVGLDGNVADGAVRCDPTQSDAIGPFFEPGSPARAMVAAANEPGERILFAGLVIGRDCEPLPNRIVDLWQADLSGEYYGGVGDDFRLRGHVTTDARGAFTFETIKPGNYGTAAGPRPAHLHVQVRDDRAVQLTTQIYFRGDPYLGAVDGCQPPTCFSGDPLRILDLVPMDGTDLLVAESRLII